jgi:hypothetical protein
MSAISVSYSNEYVALIPGYSLRVVSDPKGGYRARLVSDAAGIIIEPHDETKIGAVVRLARELREQGRDATDRQIADAIDREIKRSSVSGGGGVPEQHRRRIEAENARMPAPMAAVMGGGRKSKHKSAYRANEEAEAGYEATSGAKNPFLASSPSYYAWNLGAHFKATGRTKPRDVRMGRGYTIWGNDMLFNADTMERLK